MTRYDIALIGFGGVNRALAELIHKDPTVSAGPDTFELRIVAITDLRLGSLVHAEGVDLARALSLDGTTGDFSQLEGGSAQLDNEQVIRGCSADIVVEATFTNPAEGEPALSHIRWALESGKHVCTTNKGPVALQRKSLLELAQSNGVSFEFEGSVLSGTPIMRMAKKSFSGLKIEGFEGILNGTSNYVLGEVESGASFPEAIARAQSLGYAEADPTADIDGTDAGLKVAILANELLGAELTPADVSRVGITSLQPHDFAEATQAGGHWRLIASARRHADGQIDASVAPALLPAEHPLAHIPGALNAVTFHTDLLGSVTMSGPGAGRTETAYALISDIIAIHEGLQ